jgi:hypothetical protein
MEKMEAPRSRALNPDRFRTPEPEFPLSNQEIDWKNCETPDKSLVAIQPYSNYIDHRISSAIEGTITLTPSVARITDKRNKALNIMVLDGVLKGEELDKRRVEEARKARYKIEGGNRRMPTYYGVILKGDTRLCIAGRTQFLAQEKAKRQQALINKINRLGDYRWGITVRTAARRVKDWQEEKCIVERRYRYWMAELLHFYRTGSRILLSIDD